MQLLWLIAIDGKGGANPPNKIEQLGGNGNGTGEHPGNGNSNQGNENPGNNGIGQGGNNSGGDVPGGDIPGGDFSGEEIPDEEVPLAPAVQPEVRAVKFFVYTGDVYKSESEAEEHLSHQGSYSIGVAGTVENPNGEIEFNKCTNNKSELSNEEIKDFIFDVDESELKDKAEAKLGYELSEGAEIIPWRIVVESDGTHVDCIIVVGTTAGGGSTDDGDGTGGGSIEDNNNGGDNGGSNGGGNRGRNNRDNTVIIQDEQTPLADAPATEITDEETPLAGAPVAEIIDEETPLAAAPAVEIEDEETPKAGLPKTGGIGAGAFFLLGGALTALGIRNRRKED